MFIVKLTKYESNGEGVPSSTVQESIREANAVHVRHESDGRTVVQLGDAPGDTMEVTIGQRADCSYSVAYIMNSSGKTVETIR